MRAASRLFASVQRSTQFLEAGAPTGITGLLTHPNPRSALLFYYTSTLDKLKQFPEHSVYRQSTEALTKHRLSVIESIKPAGLEEWQARVEPVVQANQKAFRKVPLISGNGFNVVWKEGAVEKSEEQKSTEEYKAPVIVEGILTEEERADQGRLMAFDAIKTAAERPEIEAEPPLSAEQVNEIESKIGAGLIEEVIQVAQGEITLADTLLESQV